MSHCDSYMKTWSTQFLIKYVSLSVFLLTRNIQTNLQIMWVLRARPSQNNPKRAQIQRCVEGNYSSLQDWYRSYDESSVHTGFERVAANNPASRPADENAHKRCAAQSQSQRHSSGRNWDFRSFYRKFPPMQHSAVV